jgi:hypothetical protein
MLNALLSALFRCPHRKTTFPLTPRKTRTNAARPEMYVVCLDCGQEFEYDWRGMRIRKALKTTVPGRLQTEPLRTCPAGE